MKKKTKQEKYNRQFYQKVRCAFFIFLNTINTYKQKLTGPF